MLISHKYQFVVAMPSKTGTNSLRNMAAQFNRDGGDPAVLQEERELRHRLIVPDGCEGYTRYMTVRNPYDRVISMWYYLRQHKWEWSNLSLTKIASRHTTKLAAFEHFLEWFLEQKESADGRPWSARKLHGRRPFLWTDSLTEMCAYLAHQGDEHAEAMPVTALHLERIQRDWTKLRRLHDAGELAGMIVGHANAGKARKEANEGQMDEVRAHFGYSDKTMELGNIICEQDSHTFGYNITSRKDWRQP